MPLQYDTDDVIFLNGDIPYRNKRYNRYLVTVFESGLVELYDLDHKETIVTHISHVLIRYKASAVPAKILDDHDYSEYEFCACCGRMILRSFWDEHNEVCQQIFTNREIPITTG